MIILAMVKIKCIFLSYLFCAGQSSDIPVYYKEKA